MCECAHLLPSALCLLPFGHGPCSSKAPEATHMLLTLAIILLIAWALGLFAFHVTAAFIHVLIVIAIILLVLHFVRGRGV
jgi:Family of unknown function (DUF5670)